MEDLKKSAAYIKGLFDGMKLDKEKDETKLLEAIISHLDLAAERYADLDDEVDYVTEHIDDMEDFLGVVAKTMYGGDDDDDDDDMYEVTCANCGNKFTIFDDEFEDVFGDGVECPECGEPFTIDYDEFIKELHEVGDDCDCGHDHE